MPRVTVTVPNKQAQPYRFPLDREKVTLGRGGDNDIPMASGSVSVHHAHMIRVPGGFELRDLDSTNGISYHGEKKIFLTLQSGMTVKLGEVAFEFQLTPEEEESLAAEVTSPTDTTDTAAVKTSPTTKLSQASPSPAPAASKSSSQGMISVFVLLAIIAFVIGMALRYQGETGKSFINSILSR